MSVGAVAVVVVTFNRKSLLLKCLAALRAQTMAVSQIIVVDNASTDGTRDALAAGGWLQAQDVEYLVLSENMGGAGGFAAGLTHAVGRGAEWIWMMDDDAEAEPQALEALMNIDPDVTNIYASAPVCGERLSWAIVIHEDSSTMRVELWDRLPETAEVEFLPFLGFLMHRSLVGSIGIPDAGYFIAADDVEYSVRARRAGAHAIVVRESRIAHPAAVNYRMRVPGRTLYCLQLSPWKRYYDTRNRLLIARQYYGFRLLTQTIPGSFVRMWGALLHEPRKLAQLWAFFAGFYDGLLGRRGRRHERWWIPV